MVVLPNTNRTSVSSGKCFFFPEDLFIGKMWGPLVIFFISLLEGTSRVTLTSLTYGPSC